MQEEIQYDQKRYRGSNFMTAVFQLSILICIFIEHYLSCEPNNFSIQSSGAKLSEPIDLVYFVNSQSSKLSEYLS